VVGGSCSALVGVGEFLEGDCCWEGGSGGHWLAFLVLVYRFLYSYFPLFFCTFSYPRVARSRGWVGLFLFVLSFLSLSLFILFPLKVLYQEVDRPLSFLVFYSHQSIAVVGHHY
jgi:hypothetical protein